MNTRQRKGFIHCAGVLLLLGIILGMAGCSKKAVKTAAPDAIAADTEPAPIEAASSGDGLINAGSSGSRAGRLVEIVADELEFGVEGPRGTASRAGEEFIVVQPGTAEGAQTPSGALSLLEAGLLVPGLGGSADERIFIEGTSSRKAAIGTGRLSSEGERQGPVRSGTKESTTMFLIEEHPTGNIINFTDAPESDAPGSTKGARVSSAEKDETLVVTPRPKDEDSVASERAEPTSRQMHIPGDTRHADSGASPEHVPEPLIVAEVQRELLVPLPARGTEPQAPAVASAATDTFFIKEGFEDIYFDFDRWAIPKPMQVRLSEHAQWLTAHPGSAVLIEGHCDVRGSREYNMVLGEKRARSVKGFLLDLGVKEDQLSMISYGKERLTCFESREACHGDNRRAHLLPR